MFGSRRLARLRAAGARLAERPILIDGDATELLDILRSNTRDSSIVITDAAALAATGATPAGIVVLAIVSDGRKSSFMKASRMLRERDAVLADDAIRIVVVQSDRSRVAPAKIQRQLAAEIVYQVTLAVPELAPDRRWRSFRQRAGLATLEAAGLRILRFG